MQEAWLLFDEQAIRWAAGNQNGKMPMKLPPLKTIEHLSEPKEILNDLLREARGLGGKRRSKGHISHTTQRIADYLDDFTPLRQLGAFRHLESQIIDLVRKNWPKI